MHATRTGAGPAVLVLAAGVLLTGGAPPTVLGRPASGVTAAADERVDLTLLVVNDLHGQIDADTVRFAGTIETFRAQAATVGSPVALLSAGDNIGDSSAASEVQLDDPTVDVLDVLEVAASAVGEHEVGGAHPRAGYPHLAANLYAKGTTEPVRDEYVVLDMAGVRVGVIGTTTGRPGSVAHPATATYDFGDPVDAVNRVAAGLTDGDAGNGEADVLVALYHEGAPRGAPDGATLTDQLALGGPFADLVTRTSPAVDVLVTGHTHRRYAWAAPVPGEPGRTRPVLQAGARGEHVGLVALTYDRTAREVVAASARVHPRSTQPDAELVATYPRVAEVAPVVASARAIEAEVLDVEIGTLGADVTTAYSGGWYADGVYTGPGPGRTSGRGDPTRESALGNLLADASRDVVDLADPDAVRIGVSHPASVHADLLRTFEEPDVLKDRHVRAVVPRATRLWGVTLTGDQVATLLEEQWQAGRHDGVPRRPYVHLGLSANLTYTFDTSRPHGDRITSVAVDGRPIEPAGPYRVSVPGYLLFDEVDTSFPVLARGTGARRLHLGERDALRNRVTAAGALTPDVAERAVAVPALPGGVTAGGRLTFPVGGVNLTSLAAPENTSLEVVLEGVRLGEVALRRAGAAPDASATVDVVVPRTAAAGARTLTLVARPSGTTVHLPLTVVDPVAPVFSDVPPTHPHHDDIRWLAERGVTTGYGDGTFRAALPVSRYHVAAFLYRYAGSTAEHDGPPTFRDVPASHPLLDEVEWLRAARVTGGYGDGTYRGARHVTRAELVAFVWRTAGGPPASEPVPFRDVGATHPFARAIAWAAEVGVVGGYGDGTFRGADPVSRQHLAALLHRYDTSRGVDHGTQPAQPGGRG